MYRVTKIFVVLLISAIFVFELAGLASAQSWCNPSVDSNEDGVRVCKSVEPNKMDTCGIPQEIKIKLNVTWPVIYESAPADIVFAIDSSGSMTLKDPKDERIKASKKFVDLMEKSDGDRYRAAVVSWDYKVDFVCPCGGSTSTCNSAGNAILTDDLSKVKECLDKIDSEGKYTDYDPGLSAAIEILKSKGRKNVKRTIIFFTDGGVDRYDKSLAYEAKKNNIQIYTIGLGVRAPMDYSLKEIADITGGKYYIAPTSRSIGGIFDEIMVEMGKVIGRRSVTGVTVTDTIHNYLTVKENTFSIDPTEGPTQNPDGTTTMKWQITDLAAKHWETSFIASVDLNLPVDVVGDPETPYVGNETSRKISEVVYVIGRKTRNIAIPEGRLEIVCSPEQVATPIPTTTAAIPPAATPGFGAIFAISASLAIACIMRKRG